MKYIMNKKEEYKYTPNTKIQKILIIICLGVYAMNFAALLDEAMTRKNPLLLGYFTCMTIFWIYISSISILRYGR